MYEPLVQQNGGDPGRLGLDPGRLSLDPGRLGVEPGSVPFGLDPKSGALYEPLQEFKHEAPLFEENDIQVNS